MVVESSVFPVTWVGYVCMCVISVWKHLFRNIYIEDTEPGV